MVHSNETFATQQNIVQIQNDLISMVRDITGSIQVLGVLNPNEVNKIYNGFSNIIYDKAQQYINNKQINSVGDLEKIWKQIITTKQKDIEQFKTTFAKYPLDSISKILQYCVNISYPTYIINNLLNTLQGIKSLSEFEKNYSNFVNSLLGIQRKFSQNDLKIVYNNIVKQFKTNKQIIIQYLQKLPNDLNMLKEYQKPLFTVKLQEYINSVDDINDLIKRVDFNYIINQITSLYTSELEYATCYIMECNDYATQYLNKYITEIRTKYDGNNHTYTKLDCIFYTMNNLNNKDRYSAVIKSISSISYFNSQDNQFRRKQDITKFQQNINNYYKEESLLQKLSNNIKKLNNENDPNKLISCIYEFAEIHRKIIIPCECESKFSIYDQQTILNGICKEMWNLFSKKTMDRILTELQKYTTNNNDLNNLYQILTNKSFNKDTPFIKSKKISSWYKKSLNAEKLASDYCNRMNNCMHRCTADETVDDNINTLLTGCNNLNLFIECYKKIIKYGKEEIIKTYGEMFMDNIRGYILCKLLTNKAKIMSVTNRYPYYKPIFEAQFDQMQKQFDIMKKYGTNVNNFFDTVNINF